MGDVRGKGLMMAMEFVESKATNAPLPLYKCNAILERTKVGFVFLCDYSIIVKDNYDSI